MSTSLRAAKVVNPDVRAAPGPRGDEWMAALEAECERRDEPAPPTSAGYLVMADPEGNEFCLD
jgi:hypothetical protein